MNNSPTYAYLRDDGIIERRQGAGYGKIWARCARCDGYGEEDSEDGLRKCNDCHGRGEVCAGWDPDGDRRSDAEEFIYRIGVALGAAHHKPTFALSSWSRADQCRLRIVGVFR